MLTSELSIVACDRGRAFPDRLTRKAHRHYRAYAEEMLSVYREGIGRTRRDLHRAVDLVLARETDCEIRRIRAFAKLLDERSVYDTDRKAEASALRLRVFALAAPRHPLVRTPDRLFESGESEVKARIAGELGRSWEEIESGLYADVLDYQKLREFRGYGTPEELLSRYNVAQVQASLYRAERMEIAARGDFKTILRYAKLARLLHEIRRQGPSEYRISLAGPATVLRETRRYGVNLARFLPALLACRGWTMEASLRTPWGGKAQLLLSDADGLRSHLPPPEEFDSAVEESFARKFGPKREGWRLFREAEILHEGQTAFVPDFLFRHEDGTEVPFEIVGFWTPEYLAHKREVIRRFHKHRILLAVAADCIREGIRIPEDVVVYKSALKVGPVLEALERGRRLTDLKSPAILASEEGTRQSR